MFKASRRGSVSGRRFGSLVGGRARWLLVFSILLAISCAAPVLAASDSTEPGATTSMIGGTQVAVADAEVAAAPEQPETEADPAPPRESPQEGGDSESEPPPVEPTEEAQEARPGIEREEALETPQAIAEREQSQYAYTDLAPEQAAALLHERFAPQLGQIDADPSRALADVALEEVVSPTEALVTVDGETSLLESSVPLRVPDEGGEMAKVDLGLEETESGFAPANSIADISLPKSAAGQIEVGEIALSFVGDQAAASIAQPFGDEDLQLPEAAEDTSLLLSPITGGVELSALILSRRAPEQLSFAVTMPPGAELRPAPDGGAEVIDFEKQEPIARIGLPQAVDAQGTVLPASLAVKGDSILLELAHRSMDIAYPAYIDPEIEENWKDFADTGKLNYWNWEYSGVGAEDYIGWRSCIVTCWGNGLYVRSRSKFTYPAGSYGRWSFTPQGTTTYMRRVTLGPMHMDAHGCWANEPHGYVGVWNGSEYVVHAPAYPTAVTDWVDVGTLGPGARTAHVGISAAGAVYLTCGRDYHMGGAVLYLNDPELPTVTSVWGYPTGWVRDGSPFGLYAQVYDPGLGVKSAHVNAKDAALDDTKELGCAGTYNNQCPAYHTFQWILSADSFSEGEKEVQLTGKDALQNTSLTSPFMLKVDRTPPNVTLSGQLAVATKEAEGEEKDPTDFDPLSLPVYNLTINAKDGVENGGPADVRSGVKSIEVFIDEEKAPRETWTQPPCANSCDMEQTFTLKLNELEALAHHKLRVVVSDHAGNAPREREIEFEYVPATGMQEEYVLQHFPLPNGQGEEDSEEDPIRPELAVNVMNGNLVYRQLDVEVPGPAADLEVERYYNSLLPDSQDTEWGDGWTLAQTPTLEEEGSENPGDATLVEESGAVESQVELPEQVGEDKFDDQLQAVITKSPTGYEVTDESGEGEGTLIFDEAGEATELEASEYAGVEYDYEEGEISEIAVDDVASTDLSPEQAAEQEVNDDFTPLFQSPLGSPGSADGELDFPSDVALAPDGTLWVADMVNHRVQHFDADGGYLGKFGSQGSANGQFQAPVAIDIDSEGDLWVDDMNNNRVQQFDPEGNFISKFGSCCGGEAQISYSRSLAIDANDHIWVADAGDAPGSHVIKEFNQQGELIKSIGRKPGQNGFLPPDSESLGHPLGVDVAPNGDVWVADTWATGPSGWSRVMVYNQAGEFQRGFGSRGSGQGEFARNDSITVDDNGYVWVGDSENHRVQIFNQAGEYITEFGEQGSGEGQFGGVEAMHIALGDHGQVWVTDAGNDRVQRWRKAGLIARPAGVKLQDDPSVEVEVGDGLVEAVGGEEAGEIAYEHDGALLTAVDGPEGETSYAYDGNDRMTKVTLPNGTYAEIAYEATYGRVASVTVAIEGANPETTYFNYEDQPQRRTTVTPPPGGPVATYEFAADGSMFKWWNTKKPPTIDDVAGTLHDVENRETAAPIDAGFYDLKVQAFDAEGIASIQIIANNDILVSEKTCEQVPGPPVECETEKDEWVMETGQFAPGVLYVEVIATDSEGESSSERFWVNIPYTPPPDPEAEEPPRFSDILKFREDFGLDLDIKGDEEAINARIFNLIGAWKNPHTPAGEVARATADRWSVPMRSVDAAEMEFRQSYIDHDSIAVEEWAEAHYPGTYAGYYVDHRAGGIVHIGFTQEQAQRVAEIKQQVNLLAPHSRVETFPNVPTTPLVSVGAAYDAISAALETNSALRNVVISIDVNEESDTVDVGATDVGQAEGLIDQAVGSAAPVAVHYEAGGLEPLSGRLRDSGRILAGDRVITEKPGEIGRCTSGYGAWEDRTDRSTGDPVRARFLLTAGHCAALSSTAARSATPGFEPSTLVEVGSVNRNAMETTSVWATDGLAIRVKGGLAPNEIYRKGLAPLAVSPPARAKRTNVLCFSGLATDHKECGAVIGRPDYVLEGHRLFGYLVDMKAGKTDSGAPVWNPNTGASVGLVSARPIWNHDLTYVAPLLPMRGKSPVRAPGILKALSLSDPNNPELHLIVGQ